MAFDVEQFLGMGMRHSLETILEKRHQPLRMSRSVGTSDWVVIDHRLAWRLLPFTKKAWASGKRLSQSPALDHDYKSELDQVPRLFKYNVKVCDILSLLKHSHRDSCYIPDSLILSEIYVTCAFLKSCTVRSRNPLERSLCGREGFWTALST